MLKRFCLHILFILIWTNTFSQIKICSWNLENFGRSKSDSSIRFIATTLRDFDVVALVEVVAGDGGAQAVAKLVDALDRKGADWDYCISAPTQGTSGSKERYAFLWKTHQIQLKGKAWLDKNFEKEIEREPYMADFLYKGLEFTLVALHAVPKNKQPESEIKYLKYFPTSYPDKNLIFCGDFNLPASHSVFNPLKSMHYFNVLNKQKTSLKRACVEGECLASEYDNIFYEARKIKRVQGGVLHFYTYFPTLKEARTISDHLPVYFEFLFEEIK
jgi:endonuclease/exonuclease/phosphatase family metal-dependent hydrolase